MNNIKNFFEESSLYIKGKTILIDFFKELMFCMKQPTMENTPVGVLVILMVLQLIAMIETNRIVGIFIILSIYTFALLTQLGFQTPVSKFIQERYGFEVINAYFYFFIIARQPHETTNSLLLVITAILFTILFVKNTKRNTPAFTVMRFGVIILTFRMLILIVKGIMLFT